ncbi:MAG: hypothetical protein EBX41_06060 [Chitinophagia bacterium]|nr:hypothetical protein [Chitinophagia bacterium]
MPLKLSALRLRQVAKKYGAGDFFIHFIQLNNMQYINSTNKKNFTALFLLDEMIENGRQFELMPTGDDKLLEPLFIEMINKGYLKADGKYYAPTQKGTDAYEVFNKRFQEYLRLFDVFSYVDLTKGEFAFAKFFDFDNDEDWEQYSDDPRFEDLRLAVAIYKKADPAEIVFMSFLNEHRLDTETTGWQMDLLSDEMWNEIEEICQESIKPDQLGTPDVIEDIVRQGTALMIELLKEEKKRIEAEGIDAEEEDMVIEEYETVEYYQPYYDPFYISPFWLVPLFLW